MSAELRNAIMGAAGGVQSRMGQPRWGIVQSVDPSRPAAKVLIQPDGVLSGWMPILLPVASGAWGLLAIPNVGDMAFILPDLGSASDGVIVGFAHNDGSRPPAPQNAIAGAGVALAAGEIALVSKGGAVLRACTDGTIMVVGNLNVQGNVVVSGNVTTLQNVYATNSIYAVNDIIDKNGTHGGVHALRINYNGHHHPGIQAGGSSTGLTDLPTP